MYLTVSGFVGGGGVVMYKTTGGGTGQQEVARNKGVPMKTTFV